MINKFYAPGALDLTDLDELRETNMRLTETVNAAIKAKEEKERAEKEDARLKEEERQKFLDDQIAAKKEPEPPAE